MSFLCSQTGASAAIVALDGSQLGDRQISVALSNPPSRKPRQPGADQQQRATEQPGRYAHVTVWEVLLDSLNYNLLFKFVCRKRVTNIKPWFVCIACHSLYQRINWQECKLYEGIGVDEAALRVGGELLSVDCYWTISCWFKLLEGVWGTSPPPPPPTHTPSLQFRTSVCYTDFKLN